MLLWQSQNTGIQQFKGPFTNYFQVGVGGPKNQLFVNFYTIENVNRGGQVVKKNPNLVNVVCERPLIRNSEQLNNISTYQCSLHVQQGMAPLFMLYPYREKRENKVFLLDVMYCKCFPNEDMQNGIPLQNRTSILHVYSRLQSRQMGPAGQ